MLLILKLKDFARGPELEALEEVIEGRLLYSWDARVGLVRVKINVGRMLPVYGFDGITLRGYIFS